MQGIGCLHYGDRRLLPVNFIVVGEVALVAGERGASALLFLLTHIFHQLNGLKYLKSNVRDYGVTIGFYAFLSPL